MHPGTIIGGHYVVKQVLTRAWPVTWILVRDADDHDVERVVQHIAFPDVDPQTLAVRRFRFDEAFEVARRTRHPGIVSVLDRVTVEDGECVVTECVDGVPMMLLTGMRVQVDVKQVLRWSVELCETLAWLEHRPRPLMLGSLRARDVLVTPRERVRLQLLLDSFLHDDAPVLYATNDGQIDARMEAFGGLLADLTGPADEAVERALGALMRRCSTRRGAGGYPDFPCLQAALAARLKALEEGPPAPVAPPLPPLRERVLARWTHLVRQLRLRLVPPVPPADASAAPRPPAPVRLPGP